MFRFLLLISLLPICVFAQCQEGVGVPTLPRIQGYVQTMEEKPISGAKVELMRLNADGSVAESLRTETTDAQGRFRFKRYKDAIYKVSVRVGDRQLEDLRLRQGSSAMLPGGGLMNFVLVVDDSPCIGISMTK